MTHVLEDEKVILSPADEPEDDGLRHLVHQECHLKADPIPDFVTAYCGQVLDWAERKEGPIPEGIEECPACQAEERCPACNRPKWMIRL